MNILSNSEGMSVDEETTKSASAATSSKAKGKMKSKTQDIKSNITIGAKRRKNRSEVWDHFEKLKEGTYTLPEDNDFKREKCKGCNTIMICDGRYDTTNLKRHIKACMKLHGQNDSKQMLLNASSGDVSLRGSKIDHGIFREFLAKMIVRHELPFSVVEYEDVRECLAYLNLDVKHITRNTYKADVFKLYQKDESKVMNLLSSSPSRISLTSDFWSCMTSDSYMCIAAHFVDKDWKLRDFILSFTCFPPPHNGLFISDKFTKLLGENGWNIEHKLMAITLDNATNNDTFVGSYMTKLVSRGALPLRCRFFRVRCAAHVINLIVKAGLEELHQVVIKIRESVKYVKGSPSRLVRFNEAAKDKKVRGVKKLKQDTLTRWNSTYLMLESALYYKDVFPHLAIIDKHYCFCPSPDEWDKVEMLSKFFQLYYDLTNLFSGSKYPTTNLFFHGVWAIQHHLQEESLNPDPFIRTMVMRMQMKFDSYWEECNLILAVAVALDPHYKLKLVEFAYEKIYGLDERSLKARLVYDTLVVLFNEYKAHCSPNSDPQPPPSQPQQQAPPKQLMKAATQRYANDFDKYVKATTFVASRSELDLYLEELLLDRNVAMDILEWWRSVEYRWPCLTVLAHDVLSIPITSVSSEAAFSVGGRILKPSRCSLSPDSVEALVCSRN